MRRPTEGTGAWVRNDYTALHEQIIGPDRDPQDGGLFPRGWTPESGVSGTEAIAGRYATGTEMVGTGGGSADAGPSFFCGTVVAALRSPVRLPGPVSP